VQFRDDIYGNDGNAELALNTTSGMEQPSGSIDDDLVPRN
jgi:murein L,D-transpeptidase YcbB/YkuD